jgi:hypothetical protein
MRRLGHSGRVDGNHAEVVKALRRAGIAVTSLAAVGKGVPDLLACFRGVLVLLEVKRPGEKPNAVQEAFAATFPVKVVTTPEDAVLAVVEAARG